MPLRAARLLVWPFAVAAFALRVCAELWFKPLTWRIDPNGVAFLTWMAVLSSTLLVPWVGYRLLTRSNRGPATWQVDAERNRFVAPASPRWMGTSSMLLGWFAAAFVQTERIAGEDRAQLVQTTGMLALAIAVPAVVLGGIALTLLLNRPRLTLDRDGITAQGLVSRTFLHRGIAWFPADRLPRPGRPRPSPCCGCTRCRASRPTRIRWRPDGCTWTRGSSRTRFGSTWSTPSTVRPSAPQASWIGCTPH